MALAIPIVTTFDGKGISKAVNEFKNLEGASKKAQFAIKKAAIPAAAALAGLGAALFDATKGAMADEAAQALLASTIQKTTGATDAQIQANEAWISTQGKLLGVTDDELRPVLSKLVKATGSVTEAQKLATAAMDIAASTGKPLATVTDALAKAYGGNLAALGKLSPELRQMIKDGASFEEVMAAMAETTGGAATTAANTAQGKFKRLGVSLDETKESIGAALIPVIEKALPLLQGMADWATENKTAFLVIAGIIGGIATAVIAVNAAMKVSAAVTAIASAASAVFGFITGSTTAALAAEATATTAAATAQVGLNTALLANPIGIVVIAIVALVAGLVLAYKKFEGFRNIVDSVFQFIKRAVSGGFDFIKGYLDFVLGIYKGIFNGIARLWNNTVGKLSFKVPDWVPKIGGKGFDVPNIPMLAAGGIVTSPTLAMIGERGPEAVIPLSGPNAGKGIGGDTNVTIQVNGGDPQQVVNALRRYMQMNGTVPIRVSA